MTDELEVHLGEEIYFLEFVQVISEDYVDTKGMPIPHYVPRIWKDAKQIGILLNREEMPYFEWIDEAGKWAWDWVRNYHKNN